MFTGLEGTRFRSGGERGEKGRRVGALGKETLEGRNANRRGSRR